MLKKTKNHLKPSGQTLIETLAAAFILTMGVSAAVGLAIYALNSSSSIVKQIVATGLAREGLEGVKNMRDTNWLKDTLSTTCYDFSSNPVGQNTGKCYTHWLNQTFCIDPTANNGNCNGDAVWGQAITYYLGFDSNSANKADFWYLTKDATKYGLNFNQVNSGTVGFYSPASGVSCANASGVSDFCRKIILTKYNSAPYDQNIGPLVYVQSQVWWVDRKCPRASDYSSAPAACRLELDSYLTNWKNY